MKYLIFDLVVSAEDAGIADIALKEIAFSNKQRGDNHTMEFNGVVLPFAESPNINKDAIEMSYHDYLWSCFKDSRGECDIDEFIPLLPLFTTHCELLKYTTKIYVKTVIDSYNLGVVYFDGSKSDAGCSGVAVLCLNDAPNGVFDAYTGRTRAYDATGAVITENPTNNVGELNGMKFAIEYTNTLPHKYWVVIGDSEYTLKSIREWRFGWANNGWKNSQKKEIANCDLIKHLSSLVDNSDKYISFKWVKGHAGNPMNELCDLACKQMTGYV